MDEMGDDGGRMHGRGETKRHSGTRSIITILATMSLLGSLAAASGAYERAGHTEQIEVTPSGGQPAAPSTSGDEASVAWSSSSALSVDGRYVAYTSPAPDLVPGDGNGATDVFVRDRRTARTELVSVGLSGTNAVPGGAPLDGRTSVGDVHYLSFDPSISANGRYVAFASRASNIVHGDTNLETDVFVHNRRSGATERVSVDSQGSEALSPLEVDPSASSAGSRGSLYASISADGRYVSFTSYADNLVSDDANGIPDVFVHDRKTDTTERVSVTSEGSQSCSGAKVSAGPVVTADNGCGGVPRSSISGNGRYVAFDSAASDLVAGDVNGVWDVFVHDRETNETERVSVASDGTGAESFTSQGAGFESQGSRLGLLWDCLGCGDPAARALSVDGRIVAFGSVASNLVPNDTNFGRLGALGSLSNGRDTFIRDLKADRTERLSVTFSGEEGGSGFYRAALSPSGRFVAFSGTGGGLTEPDDGGVYVYDRRTGAVDIASRASNGDQWGAASAGDISADGRFVSFGSPYPDCPPCTIHRTFMRNRGTDLGIGFGGSPPKGQESAHDRICITPDLCIPPGAAVSSRDATNDLDEVLTKQGANLYGASLAYRPQYKDLFAAIELEHMPQVTPGLSPISYGLRFAVGDRNYEVRATSLLGEAFGLFDCTGSRPLCTKIADLRGGYGTTGMRVVFSLPLGEIGLESGGDLSNVVAFSGLGSHLTGATKILDRVDVK